MFTFISVQQFTFQISICSHSRLKIVAFKFALITNAWAQMQLLKKIESNDG